jgi:[ribosomal protein S5]-alanine N-acetyltransferase
MTPTLSTARLVLRPLKKPMQRNLAWLRDPEVMHFSQQKHQMHSLSSQMHYVNSFIGNSHLWGIWLADTGEYIGNVSATHDEPNNIADMGILLGETKYWGKGFGREAWKAACEWMLNKGQGNVRKLEAGCMRPNIPMIKIIRASGFSQEGELLNHFLLDGAPVSALIFGKMQ